MVMSHNQTALLHRSTFWLKQDSPETFPGLALEPL